MTFMEMETRSGAYPDTLLIFVTSQVNTKIDLDNPRLTGSLKTYNITAGKVNRIAVDNQYYYPTGSEITAGTDANTKKGLRIVAKDPVNVYCLNLELNRSDGTFVLPYESIPSAPEFFVASFMPNAGTNGFPTPNRYAESEFGIIAMDNNVKVEITPTFRTAGGKVAGTPYTVTLGRGQTYQVQSDERDGTNNTDPALTSWATTGAKNGDLTGTRIRVIDGCGKINVFSGARSIHVTKGNCGGGVNGRDHLYTQVLPTVALGKEYILMPFSGQTGGYAYKIVAAYDSTKVYINGNTLTETILKKGQWIYRNVTSATATFIRTDKPAYAVQYMKNGVCSGLGGNNGDPAILISPDVNQRLLKTIVGTATTSNMNQHWVNVMVDQTAKGVVRLNGNLVPTSSFTDVTAPWNSKKYSYAMIKVNNPSSNSIECDSGLIVVAYGVGPYESYSYSAGAVFENTSYDIKVTRKSQCPSDPVKLEMVVEGKPKIRGYIWNFGDGQSDTGKVVIHKFAKIGTYYIVVKMPVLLDCGIVDTIIRSKIISFVPGPVFDFDDTITQCAKTLNFTISAPFSSKFLYKWQDSSSNRSFTATKDGKVWIRVRDTATKCVAIDSSYIRRTDPLRAEIQFDTLDRCYRSNNFVMRDGTKYNNDAWATSNWRLFDTYKKKFTTQDTQIFKYRFDTISTNNLRFIVTSKKGCKDTLDTTLVVYPYPLAQMNSKVSYFCQNMEFSLVDSSRSNEGIGKSFWDFGNGKRDTTLPYTVKYKFTAEGNYRVRLISETTVGCRDTIDSTFVVEPAPVNSAKFTTINPCFKNNLFDWEDKTTIKSGTWTVAWSYDKTQSSTNTKVTGYKFSDTGTQRVILKSVSDKGCEDIDTFSVYVAREPKAFFVVKDSSICFDNHFFTFDDKSTVGTGKDPLALRRSWVFGDNTVGTANTIPNKTFPKSGKFFVRAIAITNMGCKDSFQRDIEILGNPDASIKVNSEDQCLKGNAFKVKMEFPWGGAGALTHSWRFGNGATSNLDSVTYSYSALGKYRISLAVKSNKGCADSAWIDVNVVETPVVALSSNRDTACLGGGKFDFTDNTTFSGTYVSSWDFGDGTSANTKNVSGKTFLNPGKFAVKLRVVTGDGCIDSATKQVEINAVPKAFFVVNKPVQCLQGNKFIFSNGSNGNGASGVNYEWYLNTVLMTTANNLPDITAPDTGDYRVRLKAISDKGCATAMDMDLRVNEHPVVSIVGGVACASSPMNFSSTASVKKGFIAKYDWNFGNGGTASQANPIYTYNAPGSYNVVLTVTSDQGCVTSTAALPVTVKVKPKADFTSKYLLSRGFETDWKFDFTGQDADFYNWVFKDGQFASGSGAILATFADTGNFSVYLRVVNSSGCSDSITKYIFLKPELLRHQINAFSPNADNLNDEFAPDKFSFGVTKYRMRIINRWGEILYYTEDPRKGWDGSDSKGGQCPEGAYTYQISFRYIDGKMYTFEGVLMLLK